MVQIKNIILFCVLFFPLIAFSATTEWIIQPNTSTLTFTATQNDAPIQGAFKKFNGKIHFDPDKLDESNVDIIVDITSLTTSYHDMTEMLITPDWFNTEKFPHAKYTAKNFKRIGDSQYEALGTLTIRETSLPTILTFDTSDLSNPEVIAEGNTKINRLNFGVGQGEWSSTNEIKDAVIINFKIHAKKVNDKK